MAEMQLIHRLRPIEWADPDIAKVFAIGFQRILDISAKNRAIC